jgi:NADPH:quinone reductase-like Zn-dependent oxidoreductase
VTQNLTLHYDRMMLILEPTPLARGLVRKKVEVVNYPDGRFAVQFNGRSLPFRTFDKIRTVQPGAIVDNKRLSAVLAMVKARQAEYEPKRQRGHVARQRPPNNLDAPGLPSNGRSGPVRHALRHFYRGEIVTSLSGADILGRDFSGVVATIGEGVTDLAVGDQVFGVLDAGIEGAYAEKLAIKAAIVARKPDRLSHLQAAAMALIGITAIWAIEDTTQLQAGETILIQGGAGGVAGFAIQLAKHLGATVITTTSAANIEYVLSLGADRVIDYNAEDFTKVVTDCDVVFDTVGGDVQARSYSVLKPSGRLVWVAPAPGGFRQPRSDVTVLRPAVSRDRAHLERIVALLDAGAIAPPPIAQYDLAEAAVAHRVSEARHLRGKLVLAVR